MPKSWDLFITCFAFCIRYEYSHEVDRMWRKTRSSGNGACRGVDPNRNWGHRWGGEGASTSPCAETYRGPRPFSEPETAAVRDFILARNSQIKVMLNIMNFAAHKAISFNSIKKNFWWASKSSISKHVKIVIPSD